MKAILSPTDTEATENSMKSQPTRQGHIGELLSYPHWVPDFLTERQFTWRDEIGKMLDHPYWTRRWIVQEFHVAKQVVIIRERECVSRNDFRKAYYAYNGKIICSDKLQGAIHMAKPFMEELAHRNHYLGEFSDLGELLRLFSECDCADPRDKIFALLGMLSDNERDAIGKYLPNYRLSEEEVIIIVLAHLRKYDRSISSERHILLQGRSPGTVARLSNTARAFETLDRRYSRSGKSDFADIPGIEGVFLAPATKLMTAALALRCAWDSKTIIPTDASPVTSTYLPDNERGPFGTLDRILPLRFTNLTTTDKAT